jgi:hypothetical protein
MLRERARAAVGRSARHAERVRASPAAAAGASRAGRAAGTRKGKPLVGKMRGEEVKTQQGGAPD